MPSTLLSFYSQICVIKSSKKNKNKLKVASISPLKNYVIVLPSLYPLFCLSRILKLNCLRIRPTWMNEERDVIGDVPLSTLMLPGTHNAGAYKVDDNVRVWHNSGILIFEHFYKNQYLDPLYTQLAMFYVP